MIKDRGTHYPRMPFVPWDTLEAFGDNDKSPCTLVHEISAALDPWGQVQIRVEGLDIVVRIPWLTLRHLRDLYYVLQKSLLFETYNCEYRDHTFTLRIPVEEWAAVGYWGSSDVQH